MHLTSRQRVVEALSGQDVDMAPVANPSPIITAELQDKVGVFFPDANTDGEQMAELALAGHTVCGYDAVNLIFGGGANEAAALGVPVDWGDKDNLPSILGKVWDSPDQIEIPDDFLDRPTVKACVDAIRLLRRELGDAVAIIGKVYGPWTLAYHTFGIEPFLMATLEDPAKTDAILEGLKEVPLIFGRAQIEAGADAFNVADHITADLVQPETYPRYLRDIHREFSEHLDIPLIFHCCGRTMDRIAHFNENGMAAFHFDSTNDAVEMRAAAEMVLVGNVNNPNTLYQGTPEGIEAEVVYALKAGIEVIAPECAAPVNSPLANVIAVREARDKFYDPDWDGRDRTISVPTAGAVSAPASDQAMGQSVGRVGPVRSPNLQDIHDAIVDMVPGVVASKVAAELTAGTDVQTILDDALIAAMQEVGDRFGAGAIFVPEMLLSAREMKSGLEVVRPFLTETGVPPRGTAVIGTVRGDVHDIGKNLFGMMLEGGGYTVFNIGVRNTAEDFFAALVEYEADILGMSAMLTTTMPYMKFVVDAMVENGIRDDYIVLVGGAPVTEAIARDFAVDAYCADAVQGVAAANRLMAARRGAVEIPAGAP